MAQIFPIDFEEKLTMAQDDYILFSDSEDGNKIKKAQYKNLKGEKGDPGTPGADGEDGAAATVTVGSVSTLPAGSSATVTNSGTSSAAVLNFGIPEGATGAAGADGKDGTDGKDGKDGTDGAAATITVGTTTTLPAGSSATVENVGTSSAAVLNFGIPKGDSGTGSGDVNGPASSTDGHLAVFDGATGKIIKDGGEIPENTKIFGFPNVNSDISSIITATASNKNVILSESLSMTEVRFYRVTAKKPESDRIVATSYNQSSGQYIDKRINYNSSKIVTSITETVKSFFDSSTVLTKTNTTAFTPTGDYQPATKKYVDDKVTTSSTAPANPTEGMVWYDTTNDELKVWDGTAWQSVGGGDVLVSDQANNIFTPGMKIWGGTESDFNNLTPDSNTAYLLLAGGPTPGRLPTGYTELQYIDSNGQQVLNSGVSLTSDYLQIQREIRYLNDVGAYNYFYNSNTKWMSMERGGDGKLSFNTASTYSLFNSVVMTQGTDYTYDITYNSGTQTLNGTSASYSGSISNKGDIYFFVGGATLSNAPSALRCYSLKLYTGNDFTLVRDFVPAVRDNDSVAGLYDVVNDVFYTSTTATDFIAGPSA